MSSEKSLLGSVEVVLAVELFINLWPRLYDCGHPYPGAARLRQMTVLPLTFVAALFQHGNLSGLLLVFVCGITGSLDLCYHRISLPIQAGLLALAVSFAQGDSDRLWMGAVLGGGYLLIALVSSRLVGADRTPGLGDTVMFAAIGLVSGLSSSYVLLTAFVLILVSQRLGRVRARQMIPVAFYLAAALLLLAPLLAPLLVK